MWRRNFSKNGTDKLHVDFIKMDKKSMLITFNGKVKLRKFLGHGTLSKTPGMEAKICKNVKIIFACPNNFELLLAFFFDGAQTRRHKTLRKTTRAKERRSENAAMKSLPPSHISH